MLNVISLKQHKKLLEHRKTRYLCRFYFGEGDDYPYRSHGQPFTAYVSLAGCLFILIVANGVSLWNGFRPQTFFSAYLAVRSIFQLHTDISRPLTDYGADFDNDLADILAEFVGRYQMVSRITVGVD